MPGGAGEIDDAMERCGFEEIYEVFLEALTDGFASFLSTFFLVFGISLIIAVMSKISLSEEHSRLLEISSLTVFSIMLFESIRPSIFAVQETITQLSDFLSAALPIFTGVLLSAGNVNTATAQGFGINLLTTSISLLARELLLPISFGVFAFAAISSFTQKEAPKIAKWLRGSFFAVFGILSTLLFSGLAMQNVIARAQDTLYLRTARQMLGSLVPAVGATISASLSSLMGAFGCIKSSMGAMGIVFSLSIFLPVFFILLFQRATFAICSFFLEFSSSDGGVRLFKGFLCGIDTLLCMYVLSFLCAIFSFVSFMRGGNAIF